MSTRLRTVTVSLSRDGGATFEQLGTINSADRNLDRRTSLAWTVSLPASNACLIRVSNGTLTATSGMFAIAAAAPPAGSIPASALIDGTINTPKLADGSVTTPKLADNAVSAQKVSSASAPLDSVLSADGNGGAAWKPLSSEFPFASITDGTNTSATLTVGSGGVLNYSGTGIVNANQFNGNTTVAVADGGTGAASLSGFLLGNGTAPVTALKAQFSATRSPGATDDSTAGYAAGSRWLNTILKSEFVCMDASAGAAVWRQTTSSESTNVKLTLPAGEKNLTAMVFDGTYVWAGTDTAPALVLKFDPASGTHTTLTLGAGQNSIYGMVVDGTYLYAGLLTSPSQVVKISLATGNVVASYTFPGTNGIIGMQYIAPYVWAVTHDAPANLLRINPADGTYTSTTLAGTTAGWGLTYDGANLWASTSGNPAQFVMINPTALTFTVYASPNPGLEGLTFDGTNVWALSGDFPAVLLKVNIANGTTTSFPMTSGENQSRVMIFDGTYLWAGLVAFNVLRIDPKQPSNHVDFATSNPTTSLVYTGNEIWAGSYNAPGTVYRIGSVGQDSTLTTGYLSVSAPGSNGVLANMLAGGSSVFNVTSSTVTAAGAGGLVANKLNVTGATTLNTLSATGTASFTGAGGVTVGSSGTAIKTVLSASATLDFPSTAANSSSTLTIGVTGAADGDPVFLGAPTAAVSASTFYKAWVSAAGVVSVRFFNVSAAAVDPPSGTFRVAVFHF